MTAPALGANARRVLEARYLRRDQERNVVETPDQLFSRVADAVAEGERRFGRPSECALWRDRFRELLTSLDFLPNSPTLMNAGTPLGQLSACFVLPVEDTMEGIFEALKNMALVQRTGGGTGFSFSALRPKGDLVASTGGEASGPVSFMRIFDCATENIKQGGKRRGANMGVLDVTHPDILEFVRAKLEAGSLRNFNISVAVHDAFMEAVRDDGVYQLIHPRTKKPVGELSARTVFDAMVECAWQTGDPGLIFLDTVNGGNPTPRLGRLVATNPCGEIPLLPYESCNLGSINLAHTIGSQDGTEIDRERLRRTVDTAVRFLDNVIEVSAYPVDAIAQMSRGNRKIGLGVMGFAELLVRRGISYDSDQAVRLAEELMTSIDQDARAASQRLGEERGVFPNWAMSIYPARGERIRNATRTAIAPTGTISIIADTSSGIEPLFALAYRRSGVLGGETLYEVNPLFLEYAERYRVDALSLLDRVRERGSLAAVTDAPLELKTRFVTALEIPVDRHLDIQAAFQRHVDNSVSKTVNLPPQALPHDVARTYRRAWELGLKGITVYRYGSKSTQVLELGLGEEAYHYDHAARCDPEECKI